MNLQRNYILGTFIGILLFVVVMLSVGCQSYERDARDAIASSNGLLSAALKKHGAECLRTRGGGEYCDVIVKGAQAQNALVTATEVYCQIPPHTLEPGIRCKPLAGAKEGLLAALNNWNTLLPEIRKAAQ